MAVSHKWYRHAFTSTFNKEADWDATDTVKSQLHTVTYSPNQDTHRYKSDLSNELAASGGYSTGGVTISPLSALTATSLTYALDSSTDPTWNPATFTARYCIQIDTSPGTDATRPLLSYVDFGADQSPSGVSFAVQWAAAGIVQVTVS